MRYSDERVVEVITQHSKLGTVAITLREGPGFQVSIDPARRHQCDEDSLAEEIEDAIQSLRTHQIEAFEAITKDADVASELSPGHVSYGKYGDYETSIRNIECTATSETGNTEAFVSGQGEFFIRFNRNTVRRTDFPVAELEKDINQAINNACKEFSSQHNLLRVKARAMRV